MSKLALIIAVSRLSKHTGVVTQAIIAMLAP